jgi:membrane protein
MRARILDGARSVLDDGTVRDTIRPSLHTLLERGRADVVSLGAVVALWSCSRATKVTVVAITLAYDVAPSRSMWRRRAVAIGLTVGAVVTGVLVLPLLVIGPRLATEAFGDLGLGGAAEPVATLVHWFGVALLAVALLTTLYHVAPPRWTPWRRDLPGAVLALVLWAGGALVLRTYIDWTITSDVTYGPFAAPIVILLWMYFTSLAVLIGAELNAEIDKMWPASRHRDAGTGLDPR